MCFLRFTLTSFLAILFTPWLSTQVGMMSTMSDFEEKLYHSAYPKAHKRNVTKSNGSCISCRCCLDSLLSRFSRSCSLWRQKCKHSCRLLIELTSWPVSVAISDWKGVRPGYFLNGESVGRCPTNVAKNLIHTFPQLICWSLHNLWQATNYES